MTVGELIEKLSKVPPDTPVLVADWNQDCPGPTDLTRVAFITDMTQVNLIRSVLWPDGKGPVVILEDEENIGQEL